MTKLPFAEMFGPRRDRVCAVGCHWMDLSTDEMNDLEAFMKATPEVRPLSEMYWKMRQEQYIPYEDVLREEAVVRPLIVAWDEARKAKIAAAQTETAP